jgi:hypothetical protein
MLMEAVKMRGQTMLYRADFAAAHDDVAMAVDKYDDRERPSTGRPTPARIPPSQPLPLAISLWQLGFSDQASESIERWNGCARDIGPPVQPGLRSAPYVLAEPGFRLGAELTSTAKNRSLSLPTGLSVVAGFGIFFNGAGLI